MAENSIMWTTGATGDGASSYTQAELVNFWLMKTFCGAMTNKGGVLLDVDNELEVTGTATPVAVNTGAAYVFGFPYENTASVDVAIPTPSSQTRVDYITLEADWTAQTVRITRVAGTEGAGTPSLTQTENTEWQIPLATASITTGGVITVTDQREFINPSMEISTSMIEADAVTGAKIADDQIDSEHYVALSIDTEHLAADCVTGAKIADDQINSEHYVAGSIDAEHLATDAVVAGKIADGAVDSTATLANNVVDDTKVGNRVPQMYRRQGGDASGWSTQGTTTYTPTTVRMQVGSRVSSTAAVSVTFPTAFSDTPIVVANIAGSAQSNLTAVVSSVTSTGFSFAVYYPDTGNFCSGFNVHWLAIGPE